MSARAIATLGLLWLAGCATTPSPPAWQPTGDPIQDGLTAIKVGPKQDRVLWQYRTAATALRQDDYALAARLLDATLARLRGLYGPDRDARKARRLFSEEAKKGFVGEPYERVMAYYYRGILYWLAGERDNSRACFRSAQLADSQTADQEFAQDYVLLDYLEGLATAKLGGDGSVALTRARGAYQTGTLPDYDLRNNVLVFVEFGRGPTKYATGEYREQLRFNPGMSRAHSARIHAGTKVVAAPAYDDLSFQATTRGGRVMDHVLKGKAQFKATTDTFGNAALITGGILAATSGHNSAADEVGAGLLVAGLVAKAISAATTPQADTRTWDNLPNYLSFAALELPPGKQTLRIEFLEPGGKTIPDLTQTVEIEVLPSNQDTVVFASDERQ